MTELLQHLPLAFSTLLIAILFIQSGLDKVFNYRGNLDWIKGHFSETFLAPTVPLMFATLTILEVATGFLSAAGLVYFIATGAAFLVFYASILGAATILALFFGQRVAQDYPGAVALVPYFLVVLVMMHFSHAVK